MIAALVALPFMGALRPDCGYPPERHRSLEVDEFVPAALASSPGRTAVDLLPVFRLLISELRCPHALGEGGW
jgi:hypothetical protein